jgi:hypothetical protein
VQTYADYAALGVTPQMTTSISGYSSAGIQDGLPALGDGAVISIANDPKVYVVSNAGIRYIPDSVTFADFGFDQSKIRNMPANITDAYPIKEDLTNSGLVNGSPVLVYAKTALRPTPQQVVNFGIKTELFTNAYSNSVLKNTSSPPLTSFFYNVDDGRIYYGSGGDLHFVSNYSSFVAYGGLTTKVTTINSNTLKLFKVGVTI